MKKNESLSLTRHCSRWQEEEAHLLGNPAAPFPLLGALREGATNRFARKRGLPLAFFWESVYEISLWCGQSVPLERFFRATVRIYGGCHVQAVRILRQKPQTGNYVSHSNIKTKRVFNPNLQNVRHQFANGEVRTVSVCTRCLRSGVVTKPVVRKAD